MTKCHPATKTARGAVTPLPTTAEGRDNRLQNDQEKRKGLKKVILMFTKKKLMFILTNMGCYGMFQSCVVSLLYKNVQMQYMLDNLH